MKKIVLFALLAVPYFLCIPATSAADPKTEVIYRASLGRAEDVKLLIKEGAKPDAANEQGVPLLALAASRNDKEGLNVMQALLDAGGNINITDNNGQTALFYAAKNGNMDAVNFLLEHKINYYAMDKNGDIARTIAHRAGHNEIVKGLDDFVNAQTAQVNQQYKDASDALNKRYEDMKKAEKEQQEAEKAALEKIAADKKAAATVDEEEYEESEDDADAAPEEEEAPADVYNSPEFQKAMHDLAYSSCAFQYWDYTRNANQSVEISTSARDDAIASHKAKTLAALKAVKDKYKLKDRYVNRVSDNAKKSVFQQLDNMPSNTYRHEHGVGKTSDMEERCQNIGKKWNEEPQEMKRRGDGDAAGRGGSGGGIGAITTTKGKAAKGKSGKKKGGGKKAAKAAKKAEGGHATGFRKTNTANPQGTSAGKTATGQKMTGQKTNEKKKPSSILGGW